LLKNLDFPDSFSIGKAHEQAGEYGLLDNRIDCQSHPTDHLQPSNPTRIKYITTNNSAQQTHHQTSINHPQQPSCTATTITC
jgi:hypothetical protein